MFSTLKQMANLSEADFEAEKKKEGLTDQAIKELMYFYKGPGEGASEQEKQDFEMAKDLQLQELRKSCS